LELCVSTPRVKGKSTRSGFIGKGFSLTIGEREAYITARRRWRLTFRDGIQVLEGALAIGRRADGLAPAAVRTRMADAQQQASTPTSVDEHPLFAKIRGWLVGVV
jgi:hypothetical protein